MDDNTVTTQCTETDLHMITHEGVDVSEIKKVLEDGKCWERYSGVDMEEKEIVRSGIGMTTEVTTDDVDENPTMSSLDAFTSEELVTSTEVFQYVSEEGSSFSVAIEEELQDDFDKALEADIDFINNTLDYSFEIFENEDKVGVGNSSKFIDDREESFADGAIDFKSIYKTENVGTKQTKSLHILCVCWILEKILTFSY